MASNLLDSLGPSDLRIVSGSTFADKEGERHVAVYSFGMDAVTWVDETEELLLLAAGVTVIETLPDDTEFEQSTASDPAGP